MKKILISLCTYYQLNLVYAFNCDGNINVPAIEYDTLNDAYINLEIDNSSLADGIKTAWAGETMIELGVICDKGTTDTELNSGDKGNIPTALINFVNFKKISLIIKLNAFLSLNKA